MNIFKGIFVKKTFKDPVCGMGTTAAISSEYNGKVYYFCSAHCKEEFDVSPGKYILDENN